MSKRTKLWIAWGLAALAAIGASVAQLAPGTIGAKVGGVVEKTAPVAGGIVLAIPDPLVPRDEQKDGGR